MGQGQTTATATTLQPANSTKFFLRKSQTLSSDASLSTAASSSRSQESGKSQTPVQQLLPQYGQLRSTAAAQASSEGLRTTSTSADNVHLRGSSPNHSRPTTEVSPPPPASNPAVLLHARPGSSGRLDAGTRSSSNTTGGVWSSLRPSSSSSNPTLGAGQAILRPQTVSSLSHFQPPLLQAHMQRGFASRKMAMHSDVDLSLPNWVPRQASTIGQAGGRSLQWCDDVARFYHIGGTVMPSCHSGMELRHATRASDGSSSPVFVVKLRHKNKSFQSKTEEHRWRATTELLLNLKHCDGMAGIIDFLEDQKTYYVVMERALGCDLYETISNLPEKRLPSSEAREVIRELLTAVAELHCHGLIHKDLKLENVMLNRNGNQKLGNEPSRAEGKVKLIDFDTVELWSGHGQTARHVLGTDQYIAPEAYEGLYSPQSDIFAVGVIAYKIMTGTFPFNGRLFDDKPGENWVGSPKMSEIKGRLYDARINFRHPAFEAEPGSSSLISRMLAVCGSDRPTAKEALSDPWLSGDYSPTRPSSVSSMTASGSMPSLLQDYWAGTPVSPSSPMNGRSSFQEHMLGRPVSRVGGRPGAPQSAVQKSSPVGGGHSTVSFHLTNDSNSLRRKRIPADNISVSPLGLLWVSSGHWFDLQLLIVN